MKIRSLTVLSVLLVTAISLTAFASFAEAADAKKLYDHYCAQCHGEKGDGKGPNAPGLTVAPRNHTDPKDMAKLSDKDIFTAIEEGGVAVGKSSSMPSWEKTLTKDEANDLVKYLRKLCNCTGPS